MDHDGDRDQSGEKAENAAGKQEAGNRAQGVDHDGDHDVAGEAKGKDDDSKSYAGKSFAGQAFGGAGASDHDGDEGGQGTSDSDGDEGGSSAGHGGSSGHGCGGK